MAFFKAKTGWQRPRKREKNSRSNNFLPDEEQKINKTSNKIKKIKKHLYGFF